MSELTEEALFSDILSKENPIDIADPFVTVATTASGRSVTTDLVSAYLAVVAERDAALRKIAQLEKLHKYWVGEVTRQATTPRGPVPPPIPPPPPIEAQIDVDTALLEQDPIGAAWDEAVEQLHADDEERFS